MNPSIPTLDELLINDDTAPVLLDEDYDPQREQAASELRYYLAQTGENSSTLEQLYDVRSSIVRHRELVTRLTPSSPADDAAWQGLAPGFTVSRLHQVTQEWRGYFSDKALLNRVFLQLSDDGLELVSGVADGRAATLQLSLLEARSSSTTTNALPGAILIESPGQTGLPLVLFAPGRSCEFSEYSSRETLAEGVDALLGEEAVLDVVAVADNQDIFALSAKAYLIDPLATPLGSLPTPWQTVIDDALDRDSEIYADLISFGSLSVPCPLRQRERKVAEYLKKLETLVGEDQEEGESAVPYRNARRALSTAVEQNNLLIEDLAEQTLPLSADFWTARYEALVLQRQQALIGEVRLQRYEGWLSEAEAELVLQHVTVPPAKDAAPVVLNLSLQVAGRSAVLQGALVFTMRIALNQPSSDNSALLFMPGVGGGVQKFASLNALKQALLFTLSCGLDTPIWQLVSPNERQALMQEDLSMAATEVETSAIRNSVESQLTGAAVAAGAVSAGERFYSDADSAELTLERLRNEWAESLSISQNQARECAIDQFAELQQSAELAANLPTWLLNASVEVRQAYARQVVEYQAFAKALEARLDKVLPSFEAFVMQRLEAQLREDHGVGIDAGSITVDLPKSATLFREIDPQYGMTKHGGNWQISSERVQFSLLELSAYNLDPEDPETKVRFRAVQVIAPQLDSTLQQALDDDYLLKLVPRLDVARHYRALLKQVFAAPSADAADYDLSTEVLLKPYEAGILLEGFAARQREQLSEDGYRLLELAAGARSMADLDAQGIEMHWVVCNPGSSSIGEHDSLTVDGACVIHQPDSNRTIIYLPDAPHDCSVIEATGLAEAKQRLIAQLYGKSELIRHLSVLAGLGVELPALSLYIDRALTNRFDGFIDFQPALHLRMTAQQLHTREWRLYHQNQEISRSGDDLVRAKKVQAYQRFLMYYKAVLSFIPGLSVVFSTRDVWESSHAANLAFSEGRTGDGVMAGVSVGLSLVDVLLTVVPGAAILGVFAKALRATTRLRQVSRGLAALPTASARSHVLVPFKGYQRPLSLSDAVAQSGRDVGTWRKDGELWIWRHGEAYQVYRRSGEQTLRLRKTGTQGYEPPVRLVNGQWLYHSDVGLKGGVKSTVAAMMMSNANPNPAFGPRQARQFLDEFEFPPAHERFMEASFASEYRNTLTVPAWAEPYRRPAPSQVEVPVAGPSSARPVTSHRPVPVAVEAPARRQRVGVAALATSQPARVDAWKDWGRDLQNLTVLDAVQAQPPVFRLANTRHDMVQINGKFFDVLPTGSQPHSSIVFLKSPTMLGTTYTDLNRVLGNDVHLQPVVATHADGFWRVHGGLFRRQIEDMLVEYRPGYTSGTNRLLAERLFELADDGLPVINGSRLINMRGTLNAWKASKTTPLPRLQDPLLMLDGARPAAGGLRRRVADTHGTLLSIEHLNSLENFCRVDFSADLPPLSAPLIQVLGDSVERSALKELMENVLRLQGYQVVPTTQLGQHAVGMVAFQRANQPHLYLMALRRINGSRIYAPAGNFPMSNAWLAEIQQTARAYGATGLLTTRDNSQLVKLIGGINSLGNAQGGKQLFAVRIADDY